MRPPRVSRSPSKFSATLWDDLLDASVISSPNLSSKIISPRRLTSMKKAFASVSEIQNESSKCPEANSTDDDETTNRPPGVKAAKAGSKKKMGDGKDLSKFQTIWSIKKEDLALKEKLSKIKLLETLIAKQGPLADYEETLKQKLITELMQ
ncbi:hypothetical protein Bca4012_094413 [Brassica carinata]|uniref:No apical meristem-associated C-terminal domain-containing protein n=1 Tax=Brassica carinata TaxID=52824 RepID=A0A8X7TXM0_BRACI|nr:hypothetical protein Bca52824_076530 [Brassica carinata]